MWWIGDWWAYGEHRYGDRAAIVQAPDWTGPSYQTCREAARVARQFQAPKRQAGLTFKHHQEVAALPEDQAEALLERAASEGLSTRAPRCRTWKPLAGSGATLSGMVMDPAGSAMIGKSGPTYWRYCHHWRGGQHKEQGRSDPDGWGGPAISGRGSRTEWGAIPAHHREIERKKIRPPILISRHCAGRPLNSVSRTPWRSRPPYTLLGPLWVRWKLNYCDKKTKGL
jgi:hypothetical protein